MSPILVCLFRPIHHVSRAAVDQLTTSVGSVRLLSPRATNGQHRTTNVSKVFQSFWVGSSISPYEKLCLRSFIDHGHSFHLYCYDDSLKVPNGVVLKDASEILAREKCFAYKSGAGKGSFAAGSNLFRYKLLAERGGWWVDTDVVCMSDDIALTPPFAAWEDDVLVNNALLCFDAGDSLMREAAAIAMHVGDNAAWGEIGPGLVTRLLKEQNRIDAAYPPEICYPIHYSEALNVLVPAQHDALTQRLNEAKFLHLWNEIFRRANVSKYLLPPAGSLMRRLAERHPVSGWTGEYKVKPPRTERPSKGPKFRQKFTPWLYVRSMMNPD